jgi:aminoglycoside phosphotransferase (APT) family kinase protein
MHAMTIYQARAVFAARGGTGSIEPLAEDWDHLLRSPEGRLAGLLDFGDAFAGPPAWDFACLRYYHGENVGRRVAAHYPGGADVLRRSLALGIAFALYKLDKTPDRPDVIERVARLIRAA